MSIYAGIDLGTSGIKIALVDDAGQCVAQVSRHCAVDRPHPGWSQQDPDLWWQITQALFDQLHAEQPKLLARLRAISLSGQMLGPVFLDASDRPTTPCILWNDQRSIAECKLLSDRVPDIGWRANGQPDPGFGAPKILWLAGHDPTALARADVLMLPKDYVRLCLTGDRATEVSDASGTMLMDCATRTWDDELLNAAGWSRDKLPDLLPSHAAAGVLREPLRQRWTIPQNVVVATGCGDNYAGALGVGASRAGQAALSIGTSGVLSAVDERFRPAPDRAVLTTPHAVPDTFLSMGVVMSATQSLDWIANLSQSLVSDLMNGVAARLSEKGPAGFPIARPSLTGVRTPDNRPEAGAAFAGITAVSDKYDLTYAVIEGVAFQFFDCFQAQSDSGVPITDIKAIGGGTKSHPWTQLIATLCNTTLEVPENGDIAACLGAAKLAKASLNPSDVMEILGRSPTILSHAAPQREWSDVLMARHQHYRALPFQ
ncbi:MAG: xylulokinase [Paracoccaceae bacterium]|nr:xylulokinase [Paracoccaceae bacterium]